MCSPRGFAGISAPRAAPRLPGPAASAADAAVPARAGGQSRPGPAAADLRLLRRRKWQGPSDVLFGRWSQTSLGNAKLVFLSYISTDSHETNGKGPIWMLICLQGKSWRLYEPLLICWWFDPQPPLSCFFCVKGTCSWDRMSWVPHLKHLVQWPRCPFHRFVWWEADGFHGFTSWFHAP